MNFDSLTFLPKERKLESPERTNAIEILEAFKGDYRVTLQSYHTAMPVGAPRVSVSIDIDFKGVSLISPIFLRSATIETTTLNLDQIIHREIDNTISEFEEEIAYYEERIFRLREAKVGP